MQGETLGPPRELALAPEDGGDWLGLGVLPSIWLGTPSGVCPVPLLRSGLPHPHLGSLLLWWLRRHEQVCFLRLSFHICQMGRVYHRVAERSG